VYEKDFKELEKNKKKLKQLEEEYAEIRERLEIACQKKQLRSWHGRRIRQNADTQIFLLQSKKFQYTFTKINVYWNCIY
jgi:cell shape-determining protein MreC